MQMGALNAKDFSSIESGFRRFSQIRDEVSLLRHQGNVEGALVVVNTGIREFPDSNLFYKIKGDILWQVKNEQGAADCYIDYLGHLNGRSEYFKNFAKFWIKYKKEGNDIDSYNKRVLDHFNHLDYDLGIRREIAGFFLANEKGDDILIDRLLENNPSKWVSEKEQDHIWDVYCVLYGLYEKISTGRLNTKKKGVWHNAFYFVSVMEKYELYELGALTAKIILEKHDDQVEMRTMFRLCRKNNNYSIADEYLERFPKKAEWESFNVQYELFYYYLMRGDESNLLRTLKKIRTSSLSSIPISRTLLNFYIRLGMFDEAEDIRNHIERLKAERKEIKSNRHPRKGEAEEIETENEVWSYLKDMATEQEHNRQMMATYDLLRGFSHELGQPMTNIRYGIQLYQMEHSVKIDPEVESLLDGILKQTIRIKDLLQRVAPITSSKGKKEWFDCREVIDGVFVDLDFRLRTNEIRYQISGDTDIWIYGDRIQFSQIFYNLIINAADAMRSQCGERRIEIELEKTDYECHIFFSDIGPGIDKNIQHKVFTPFFSTKDKNSDDGGSGLGLYIVWNVIKMFNGTIRINERYKKGAQFVIDLPMGEDHV